LIPDAQPDPAISPAASTGETYSGDRRDGTDRVGLGFGAAPTREAGMEEKMDVVLSIHLVEDEIETVAVAQLDLREDHFEARGRARRNPVDPARPVIGEELAIARALAALEAQINDSVQEKIDRFLIHTD
jgi:hypothetical protein